MEQIHGQQPGFEVIAEDVGIVVLLGGGDALFLLQLVHRRELIAQPCGGFKLFSLGGGQHACLQRAFEVGVPSFQKQLRVADGRAIGLGRRESLHAGAQAAMNVVLQAGARMIALQIDLAAGDEKAAMDQLDDAIGEVAGKVGAVVGRSVLAQAAGHKDFGKAVGQRQLHVGIGLVVAQQDVEPRMALLDEVVFQSQRLVLVGHQDVVQIDGLAHQRAGLCIGLRGLQQVGAHARAQVLRLADVDDLALGVLVEVDTGLRGKRADFLVEVHKAASSRQLLAASFSVRSE